MAVYAVSPEEDKLFKSQGMGVITPLMPFSSARNLEKTATGKILNIGLGDFPLMDNPALYDRAIDNTYNIFNDKGISIFDPSHPLGPGGKKMTNTDGKLDFQNILQQLLNGSMGGGGTGPGTPGVAPGGAPILPGTPTKFADNYKPPVDNSEALFQDYLKTITASPAAEESLKQTLEGVDRDTNQSLATTRLDTLDRGIGGPGQYGDIEANALAQVRAGGDRTKAAARTALAQSKEAAVKEAYGKRYDTGVASGVQGRNIAAQGALADTSAANELIKTKYQGDITMGEGAATRASAEKLNMVKNLLDYAVETGKMTLADKHFYDELLAQAEQNALNRSTTLQNTRIGASNASNIAQGNNDTAIITALIGGLL
jgi:hypothetical protein